MIQPIFRPIDRWPRERTKVRKNSPFVATYNATLSLLERELRHLRGKNVIIQLALQEKDIRLDGWPRANAKTAHPGVILSFESVHGPLQYCCDRLRDWESNLRAIGLTLEHLRKADLYGVTEHGEQYKGWQQLPPPPAAPEQRPNPPPSDGVTIPADATEEQIQAASVLASLSAVGQTWTEKRQMVKRLLEDANACQLCYRELSRKHHPDMPGGNHETMQRINQAAKILRTRHGL